MERSVIKTKTTKIKTQLCRKRMCMIKSKIVFTEKKMTRERNNKAFNKSYTNNNNGLTVINTSSVESKPDSRTTQGENT